MSNINILSLTFVQGEFTFSNLGTISGKNIKDRFIDAELHGEYIYIIREHPKLKLIYSCANKCQAQANFDKLVNLFQQK